MLHPRPGARNALWNSSGNRSLLFLSWLYSLPSLHHAFILPNSATPTILSAAVFSRAPAVKQLAALPLPWLSPLLGQRASSSAVQLCDFHTWACRPLGCHGHSPVSVATALCRLSCCFLCVPAQPSTLKSKKKKEKEKPTPNRPFICHRGLACLPADSLGEQNCMLTLPAQGGLHRSQLPLEHQSMTVTTRPPGEALHLQPRNEYRIIASSQRSVLGKSLGETAPSGARTTSYDLLHKSMECSKLQRLA